MCVCECTRECVGMPMFLCAFCVNECLCACGVFVALLFSRSVVSDSLRPRGPQHARPPCPSPAPGAGSHSRPWSR